MKLSGTMYAEHVKFDYLYNCPLSNAILALIKPFKYSGDRYLQSPKDPKAISKEISPEWHNLYFIELNMFVNGFEVIYPLSQTCPLHKQFLISMIYHHVSNPFPV